MEERILIKGKATDLSLKFKQFAKYSSIVFAISIVLMIISSSAVGSAEAIFIAFYFIGLGGLVISAPIAIITFLLYTWMSECEIIVTDKRVYGKAAFKNRVDIPVDSISAVGTSFLNGISIGSSSGRIMFFLIANNIEIHSCISNMIIERQKSANTAIISNSDSADELKKFKELLDSGVITQAEFDAKKKQILGL